MKRSEFEKELDSVKKWDSFYSKDDNRESNAASNRLLKWYDEAMQELGYVYAQRDTVQDLTRKNVELKVKLDSALIELDILRSQTRAGDDDD